MFSPPVNRMLSAYTMHKSFAYLEMASCLSKMLFRYDMDLVNRDLDWEAASRCYVMWWKAPVMVCFKERAAA